MKIKATLILGILFTLSAVFVAVTKSSPELSDGMSFVYTALVIAGPSMILLGGAAREIDNYLLRKKRNAKNV